MSFYFLWRFIRAQHPEAYQDKHQTCYQIIVVHFSLLYRQQLFNWRADQHPAAPIYGEGPWGLIIAFDDHKEREGEKSEEKPFYRLARQLLGPQISLCLIDSEYTLRACATGADLSIWRRAGLPRVKSVLMARFRGLPPPGLPTWSSGSAS
jgi:hypothetical protein